jgi:protease-4
MISFPKSSLLLSAALCLLAAPGVAPAQSPAQKEAPKKAPVSKAVPAAPQKQAKKPAAKKPAPKAAEETPKTRIHVVKLSGSYADQEGGGQSLESLLLGGGGQSKSAPDLVQRLHELAQDEKAETVLFDLTRNVSISLANLPDVADAMQTLRKSGKRLYAYLKNASIVQYQIAAMCDRVYMAEMGSLDLPSPAMSTMHMKQAFDRFGIEMDVVRCGDFKGAVEPYMLPKMSAHLRAHYIAMLETMNADIVGRIAEGRSLDPKWVRAMQAKRMFTAEQAKAEGLVDALVPWRDAVPTLVDALELGEDFETTDVLKKKKSRATVNPMLMLTNLFKKKRPEKIRKDTVAVLNLQGTIVDGTSASPGSIVSGATVEEIQRLRDNDKVKAVVVRVNSPGGSATASEAILVALKELGAKKPIVISMGSLAASGGYWISCTGSKIFAQPGTITGSIGVFGTKPSLAGAAKMVGLHESQVTLDDSAGMDSMFRSWTPEEKQRVQAFVDDIYDRFLDRVSSTRKLPRSVVEKIAGGRVWSGTQAKANGLVDELGGLQDALAHVKKLAKIEGEIEVKHFPKAPNFLESLAEQLGGVQAVLPAPSGLRMFAKQHASLEQALQVLADAIVRKRAWNVWALSPVAFDVR